ncbi:hypothetical protein D3C80_1741250 [compost metagenome]
MAAVHRFLNQVPFIHTAGSQMGSLNGTLSQLTAADTAIRQPLRIKHLLGQMCKRNFASADMTALYRMIRQMTTPYTIRRQVAGNHRLISQLGAVDAAFLHLYGRNRTGENMPVAD